MTVTGLTSFTLRDMVLLASTVSKQPPILVMQCTAIEITGCHFKGQTDREGFCALDSNELLEFSNNTIELEPSSAGASLVISRPSKYGNISNNRIAGNVRLYGLQKAMTAQDFGSLAKDIRGRKVSVQGEGDLHIRCNSLRSIVVSSAVTITPEATIASVCDRLTFEANTITKLANQWLAGNISFMSNYFKSSDDLLGVVASGTLIAMGNSANQSECSIAFGSPNTLTNANAVNSLPPPLFPLNLMIFKPV